MSRQGVPRLRDEPPRKTPRCRGSSGEDFGAGGYGVRLPISGLLFSGGGWGRVHSGRRGTLDPSARAPIGAHTRGVGHSAETKERRRRKWSGGAAGRGWQSRGRGAGAILGPLAYSAVAAEKCPAARTRGGGGVGTVPGCPLPGPGGAALPGATRGRGGPSGPRRRGRGTRPPFPAPPSAAQHQRLPDPPPQAPQAPSHLLLPEFFPSLSVVRIPARPPSPPPPCPSRRGSPGVGVGGWGVWVSLGAGWGVPSAAPSPAAPRLSHCLRGSAGRPRPPALHRGGCLLCSAAGDARRNTRHMFRGNKLVISANTSVPGWLF